MSLNALDICFYLKSNLHRASCTHTHRGWFLRALRGDALLFRRLHARACTHTYDCGRQRLTLGVFSLSPPYFLRQSLSLVQSLSVHLDWLAYKPQGSSWLLLLHVRVKAGAISPGFLCGCWDSVSDACVANLLPTDPSPQSFLLTFFFNSLIWIPLILWPFL